MRPAILVLSAALLLDACSTSLAPVLPSRGPSAPPSAPVAAVGQAAPATTSIPAVAIVPGTRPDAIVPAATSPAIDLGALALIVARLPRDLYRFEIDLFICAGAIVAIGIVNAFLIASLLATRRRDARASQVTDAAVVPREAPVAVGEPAASHAVDATAFETMPKADEARTCACGAAIGARSKTGRCRRCATASRAKRPRHEVATARA